MRTIILKNESNTNQSNINQSKAIQQISFTWNLHQPGNTIMFFIIKQAKKLLWVFHKKLCGYCKFVLL